MLKPESLNRWYASNIVFNDMTVQALIPLNHFAKSRDLSRFFLI